MEAVGSAGIVQVAWTRLPSPATPDPTRPDPATRAGTGDTPGAPPTRGPSSLADDLLRYVVGWHLELPASQVRTGRICPRCGSPRHGRPAVAVPPRTGLHVSISRAPGLIVVAATTLGPVGVDVERRSAATFPGFDSIALAHTERPAQAGERGTVWVRKEAVVKALGLGVSRLGQVDVGPADRPAADIVVSLKTHAGAALRLTDLSLADGYAAAVAVLAAVPALVTTRQVPLTALREAAAEPVGAATPGPAR